MRREGTKRTFGTPCDFHAVTDNALGPPVGAHQAGMSCWSVGETKMVPPPACRIVDAARNLTRFLAFNIGCSGMQFGFGPKD